MKIRITKNSRKWFVAIMHQNTRLLFVFYPGKASAVHSKVICTPQKIDKKIRLNHTHLTNFVYPYLQTVFLPL